MLFVQSISEISYANEMNLELYINDGGLFYLTCDHNAIYYYYTY